jgi:hypothetical protein
MPIMLETFADLSTPLVADACVRCEVPLRAAPPGIRPVVPGHRSRRPLTTRSRRRPFSASSIPGLGGWHPADPGRSRAPVPQASVITALGAIYGIAPGTLIGTVGLTLAGVAGYLLIRRPSDGSSSVRSRVVRLKRSRR